MAFGVRWRWWRGRLWTACTSRHPSRKSVQSAALKLSRKKIERGRGMGVSSIASARNVSATRMWMCPKRFNRESGAKAGTPARSGEVKILPMHQFFESRLCRAASEKRGANPQGSGPIRPKLAQCGGACSTQSAVESWGGVESRNAGEQQCDDPSVLGGSSYFESACT